MAKFTGRDLHQALKDLDDKTLIDWVRPDAEEVQAAIDRGEQPKPIKIIVTPYYLIRKSLRADLSEQTSQGRIPDPHETKKIEVFEVLKKVTDTKVDSPELILESEEITIIKTRAEKLLPNEWYGVLHGVLEHGKSADQGASKDMEGGSHKHNGAARGAGKGMSTV